MCPARVPCRRKPQGIACEQIDLARHVAAGVLVKLGNTAPMASRSASRSHDTAPISVPARYFWRFRGTVSPFLGGKSSILCVFRSSRSRCFPKGWITSRLAPSAEALTRLGLKADRFVLAVGNLATQKNLGMLDGMARVLAWTGAAARDHGHCQQGVVRIGRDNAARAGALRRSGK
jgi:hypothetical protein